MTPTREQIEAARAWLEAELLPALRQRDPYTAKQLSALLAATTPPTDEELREEAAHWAGVGGHGASGRAARAGYIAGARREGRQKADV